MSALGGLGALAVGLAQLLLGMWMLREGLRQLAGAAFQRALARFTKSALSGALTGAIATAAVQSSSATVVTAIGFAGAGLLEFSQALGIVFGANVGTTVTGWVVLALGIRWKVTSLAPFLVLAGVIAHLYGGRRLGAWGRVGAGFALTLLGVEALGSTASAGQVFAWLGAFPADSWGSRLTLLGLGAAITVVTQSSSAGVAASLAALHAGALTFPQAAALVVGFDIGTTSTALIATLRGSLAARRTGYAHVIFNLLTALGAFFLLGAMPAIAQALAPGTLASAPEVWLVAFHSAFNVIGVAIALPLAKPFAALVERFVPERPGPHTERLDPRLLAESDVALRAAAATLGSIALHAFGQIEGLLTWPERAAVDLDELEALERALLDTQQFVARIRAPAGDREGDRGVIAALHAVDELHRLLDRLRQSERAAAFHADPELAKHARAFLEALPGPLLANEGAERRLEAAAAALAAERSGHRQRVLTAASQGALTPTAALDRMDAWRWLERVAHHAWRIVHHVARAPALVVAEREPPEPT